MPGANPQVNCYFSFRFTPFFIPFYPLFAKKKDNSIKNLGADPKVSFAFPTDIIYNSDSCNECYTRIKGTFYGSEYF